MIEDRDIPGADPEAVIEQYERFLYKLAQRYESALNRTGAIDQDDLVQVGRVAVIAAQQKYDPEQGPFIHYLSYYARNAMRRALGFNSQTGEAPAALVYLDAPVSKDSNIKLGETIPDPRIQPFCDSIIDDEIRTESIIQVREAVARMRSSKQREIIERIHFSGETKEAAADAMGIKIKTFREYERIAREHLRRDHKLRQFVYNEIPFFHVGVSRFNSTWTSSVEAAVIWREERYKQDNERITDRQTVSTSDPTNVQTSI